MKYEKSRWYVGLLFAEEQRKLGWRLEEFCPQDQYVSWVFKETEGKQTVFGEPEWLDGVWDYYKHLRGSKV